MPDAIMLTDMGQAEPAAALGPVATMGQWGLYSYGTADITGQAVYCRPFANPPELTLSLPARGWHRVYLGIHYGHTHNSHVAKLGAEIVDQTLWARLTGDRAYRLIEPEYAGTKSPVPVEKFGFTDIVEVLWRSADLQGQALHIAPRRSARCPGEAAGLAWIRLEPLTEQEVRACTEPATGQTARLIYIGDCDLHDDYPVSQDGVHRLLDPLADTDFDLVLWQTCMGDVCYYPTDRFPRAYAVDGICSPYGYAPEPRAEGFDVLQTVCDTCHHMGLARIIHEPRRSGGGGCGFGWRLELLQQARP